MIDLSERSTKGSFSRLLLHLHPRTIPEASARVRFTWCFGGLAVWMFLIESITGVVLMLRYVPTLSDAYPSIQDITHIAPYGFFVRNLHYWCGQGMVVLVVLHMVRVFVTGSFAAPRRMNWLIGLMLLIGTLLVDFTGYLLIWDDRALWAWTIARNLTQGLPILGPFSAAIIFGPPELGDMSLIRLYAWHVVVLPAALVLLMGWHFWRVRKDGGISKPL
ncbi:MAG: cytochrome b N-terminal domain-containing protein [Desulfomonilaceae bacterium]|nr:cytochrome b N-terminal domain-containing protein [Desulfomonilaceae bacterium]